jgi:hypothetical protein
LAVVVATVVLDAQLQVAGTDCSDEVSADLHAFDWGGGGQVVQVGDAESALGAGVGSTVEAL